MDYRDLNSHAQGVYPTKDTARMRTANVKEADKNMEGRSVGILMEKKVPNKA